VLGPAPRNRIVAALLRGLRDQGYVYGQHFVTEGRAGESRPERFPVLAAELVRLQLDVIVAAGPFLPASTRICARGQASVCVLPFTDRGAPLLTLGMTSLEGAR
jgi:hypothetical protein